MIILFITNYLPPIVDGVGDYTYNMAMEFARHGHKVHVICRANKEICKNYQEITVVPVIKNWNKTVGKTIAAYVRLHHVDVVSLQYVPHGYDHRGLPFAIVHLIKQIRKAGIPLYTFFHEVCIGSGKWYQIYRNIGACLMALIAKQIGDNSTCVGTSIEHYRKRLKALHINNVSLIHIPSNVPVVYTDESYKDHIREAIADKNDTIITLFGNRDFSAAVDAVRFLRDNGAKIKVIALGKANSSIPKEDFIYFTGTLEISRLALYLQITDILILPEDSSSGCSLKSGSLAAALQFGIPTITARGFMTDDNLSDLFLFAKENTIEEYTTLIKELMNNDGLRDKLKKDSADFAKCLTWQAVYENYMEVLSKLERR